jgi:hypothetical protein
MRMLADPHTAPMRDAWCQSSHTLCLTRKFSYH